MKPMPARAVANGGKAAGNISGRAKTEILSQWTKGQSCTNNRIGQLGGDAYDCTFAKGKPNGGRRAMNEDHPALAASLMVGSLFLLALQDSLVKLASANVSLWQFQSMRAGFNLAMLFVLARFIWGSSSPRPKRLWTVILRSMFLMGAMICFFGAIPFLSLSQVAAGLYVFPLFVTVLSALVLGEKVGPRRVIAVLTGFGGTLLILKPGSGSFQWVSLAPVLAGLFYAATVLTTRKLCRQESPATLALGVSLAFVLVGACGIIVLNNIQPGDLALEWPYLFVGWKPLTLSVTGLILACSILNLSAMCGRLRVVKGFDLFRTAWSELPCVRPVDAALDMAAGHNALRRSGPGQKHALKSTRSLGATAQVGCPGLWADWLGCVVRSLPSPTSLCGKLSRLFVSLPQAACGSGVLYFSLRTIMAHAMRAILLASATAAIFVERLSMSLTSQGWRA
jgi:drug/metabolite transporter (DMT)-like permease